VGDETAEEMA
jgi:hypothetical protein